LTHAARTSRATPGGSERRIVSEVLGGFAATFTVEMR
jgi:hypothetical protein